MKSVRMVAAGRPLETYDVPVPEPAEGEVLVRVRAAGICHSDAHYRAGLSSMGPLPLALGHEIAGTVERWGSGVSTAAPIGARVALHYLVTCGVCRECRADLEAFCPTGAMLGHHRDGGYAEFVAVPARNAVLLPDVVPFEQGAILMCSAATAYHALRRARVRPGDTVAVFGVGGLGVSAVQLARILGAARVYAVDRAVAKLALAERLGATPVDAGDGASADRVLALTGGRGVDVALEMVGAAATMAEAVRSLAPRGRAVIAGIGTRSLTLDPYSQLIGREAEVMGSNDHSLGELYELMALAGSGALDLREAVTRRVPLEATAINEVLDDLEAYRGGVRAVTVPE